MTTVTHTMEPMFGDELITEIRAYQPGWLAQLVGFKPSITVRKYIGNCTIWSSYPAFKSCGVLKELQLCEVWARIKHERNLARGGPHG